LEQLEERTALSVLSGASTSPAPLPAPASTSAPATSGAPAPTNQTTATDPKSSAEYTAAPANGTPTTDATPDAEDDDSAYSATNAGPGNTATSSGTQWQSSQTSTDQGKSNPTTPAGTATDSQSGSYSAPATSPTPATNQTTQANGSYYSQSDAKEYYRPDYYTALYAKQEAVQAQQVEEAVTLRLMQPAQGTAEPPAVTETAPPADMAETPSSQAATPNGGYIAAASVGRAGDVEVIPALHHRGVPIDGFAELEMPATGEANDAASMTLRSGETLAAAEHETAAVVPEAAGMLIGAVPLDLEALERGVGRFFAHLEAEARNWLTWPGIANLGWWLAAGTAATAAFELARRSARPSVVGGAGAMIWQDPALSLFNRRDEL
jgi:hypothetical protein